MNQLAGRLTGHEVFELLGADRDAGRRAQRRHQHAIARPPQQLRNPREIVRHRQPGDPQTIEAEQAVHQNDRGTELRNGHLSFVICPLSFVKGRGRGLTSSIFYPSLCLTHLNN